MLPGCPSIRLPSTYEYHATTTPSLAEGCRPSSPLYPKEDVRSSLLFLCLALMAPSPASARPETTWSRARQPASGPAEAIGGYSKGCLQGAVALKRRGENYRVARPKRHRHFGHPELISVIEALAKEMKSHKLGVLYVSDLAQPQGGPSTSGHASHQSGLDADVWYLATKRGKGRSIVDRKRETKSSRWSSRVPRMLELAATDERVARIFVHPVIKRELCEETKGERSWLQKLRPWWGHDSHFHVRLHCPKNSPDCEAQAALPKGDGCAELEWWFDKEAQADRKKSRKKYSDKVGAQPELPGKCQDIAARSKK